jgi:hypothetical protein
MAAEERMIYGAEASGVKSENRKNSWNRKINKCSVGFYRNYAIRPEGECENSQA